MNREDFVDPDAWVPVASLTTQPSFEAVEAASRIFQKGDKKAFLHVMRQLWESRTAEVRRLTGDLGVD